MDWRKTKTILILALVFMNIFLIVVFLKNNDNNKDNLSDELIKILEAKGILFEKKDYEFPNDLKRIYVDYNEYNKESIARRFLGNSYMKSNEVYLNKDYYFDITEDNTLTFNKRGVSLGENKTTIDESIFIANEFIESVGFLEDSVKLVESKLINDYIVLNYRKVVDNRFIEKSYMTLEIFNDRIVNFERKWLNHNVVDTGKNNIISFENALYKFESKLKGKTDIVVKDIELGYVLENDIFIQNIQSGEAFPYYKFYLDNGNEIYIEAIKN
ncbi:hypothetical protein QUF55_09285, partial [Clostridiaceae bacterium HSG29]|nr:hypothetical protein [Clostridiaceae bacterium HSG29]